MPTGPVGSGKIEGAAAFTALASLQSASHRLGEDGGIQGTNVTVSLYDSPVTCNSRADGGVVGGRVMSLVVSSAGLSPMTGVFGGPDAGQRTAVAMLFEPDAGLIFSKSGVVTLASVEPCSVTGSFDMEMASADGGSSRASGTFSSVFCPL